MALTKSDIITRVRLKVGFKNPNKGQQLFLFPELDQVFLSEERARQIVNTLFEQIKKTLCKGEDVAIQGFGKFHIRYRWAKKGRNPRTGQPMMLRSRRVVAFRSFKRLKERMNQPRSTIWSA